MALVLIVDNSPDLQEIFTLLLTRHQHKVMSAASAEELFLTLENVVPDVIFIDVFLNGEDGRTVCASLKNDARYSHVKVILMSALITNLADYRNYLADDILEKPFSIATVIEKLTAATS